MNIFVYGDESGVLDYKHWNYYVFGGVIFLDKESRDIASRKYNAAESKIQHNYLVDMEPQELKATRIKPYHKAGLFRSTNGLIRYAFIITQSKIHPKIFNNKKTKQRYLDYVYKIGLKRCFESFLKKKLIESDLVKNIYVVFDEHTTATDGKYELEEALNCELKDGTFNFDYGKFYQPLFPAMSGRVSVKYRDSKTNTLVRASDIIANHAYHLAEKQDFEKLANQLIVVKFPEDEITIKTLK